MYVCDIHMHLKVDTGTEARGNYEHPAPPSPLYPLEMPSLAEPRACHLQARHAGSQTEAVCLGNNYAFLTYYNTTYLFYKRSKMKSLCLINNISQIRNKWLWNNVRKLTHQGPALSQVKLQCADNILLLQIYLDALVSPTLCVFRLFRQTNGKKKCSVVSNSTTFFYFKTADLGYTKGKLREICRVGDKRR